MLAHGQQFTFERDICTGLGDRLGLILTLAALARVENASVAFKWCTDPSPVLSRIRPHIPLWNGYNFSLSELQNRFNLPVEIVFAPLGQAAKVQWQNVGVPAEECLDSVYTIAWRTMRLSVRHTNGKRFIAAYKDIGRSLKAKPEHGYAVLHLRGPDRNTPDAYDHDPAAFCTAYILRRLGMQVIAISNNPVWANDLLDGRLVVSNSTSPYDDMELLWGASAIVQHVWGSWSSFSTVPALATSTPIITTYRGTPSRTLLLQAHDSMPKELYTCHSKRQFLAAIHS